MIFSRTSLLLILTIFLSVILFSNAEENVVKSVKDLKYKLNSGNWIPMVGFGTWKITDAEEIRNSLDFALGAGFRHIDTAQVYGNEDHIGNTLKTLLPKYNLSREDIFITSKINPRTMNSDGYEAVKESLRKLQTDYIDLYLIHNPAVTVNSTNSDGTWTRRLTKGPSNIQSRDKKWCGLVKAKKEGLVKSIGVSNYALKHLKEVLANDHGVKPAVNQIAWNPFYQPREILDFCRKEGILVIGYSSLGSTGDPIQIREDLKLKRMAEKLGKTPSQVLLRWALQDGIAIIPKALSKNHIVEDIDLDFVLPEEDVQILNSFKPKGDPLFDIDNID